MPRARPVPSVARPQSGATHRTAVPATALRRALALVAAALLAGCGDAPPAPVPGPAPEAGRGEGAGPGAPLEPTREQVTAWTERLRALAGGYRSLSRVDDLSRWAPEMCWMPRGARVPMSVTDEATPHGRKLYALWAKDLEAYAKLSDLPLREPAPEAVAKTPGVEGCSQVLVKEAFEPVEIGPEEKPAHADAWFRLRPAERDGKRYRPGDRKGLFVLFRLDPKTPGTDDGWVYGTVAPDGAVTAVGRVATCIGCHKDAPHGRLFGLPKDTVVR